MGDLSISGWIDVAALALLAWGFGRGLFRGPFREILAIAGSVLAFVVAVTLNKAAYAWTGFDLRTGSASLGHVLWFFILLFGTSGVFRLIDYTVRRSTEKTGGLGFTSRVWGGAIGAGKSGFFVLLGALCLAALPLGVMGMKLPYVSEARESRTIRFAESNRWIVSWLSRTSLLDGLRSYLLDGTSAAMAETLLPKTNEAVHGRATHAFRLLIEDTDRIDRLADSSSAREFGLRLETNAAFARFLADSPGVAEAREDGRISLSEVQSILQDERGSIEGLLADRGFCELLLSADLDRIAAEADGTGP